MLLFLTLAVSAATASSAASHPPSVLAASGTRLPSPPKPPPLTEWPPVFHAVLVSEGDPRPQDTSDGGDAPPAAGGAIVDLYYDWPRQRNANIVRLRLSNATLHDIEWGNKTSFYWTTEEGKVGVTACKTITFPVGLLPPDWLKGADYRGRFSFDGVPCDLWTKQSFVEYCARVGDGVPVQWRFTAEVGLMHMRVFRWEVGGEGGDDVWQAPGACFG